MVVHREVAVKEPSGLCGDMTGDHGGGWVAIQGEGRRPGQRRHVNTALEPGGTGASPTEYEWGRRGWLGLLGAKVVVPLSEVGAWEKRGTHTKHKIPSP